MGKLIDTSAAAAYVCLARATLAKMRVRGGGPAYVKLGAKVLYDVADLDAWVEAQGRRRSTSDARGQSGRDYAA